MINMEETHQQHSNKSPKVMMKKLAGKKWGANAILKNVYTGRIRKVLE